MQRQLIKLLEPKANGIEIIHLLIELLEVKISFSTIKKELEEHPNYPSILSISDLLTNYGVENVSLSFNRYKLTNAPPPFITQIMGLKTAMNFFTVVKNIENDTINFFDPEKHQWTFCLLSEFLDRCTGVVLLTNVLEGAGEKEYGNKIRKEKRERNIRTITISWIPVILMIAEIIALIRGGNGALLPIIFSLLALAGSIVGVLLIWYELDQYNPLLQQICNGGKKTNCGAILQSKASKIAGVSWSSIGFSYFMGSLLLLLFLGITNPQALFILAWFSLLAILYVFYSVYYQWHIAKQWCVLCLLVQCLLTLQLVTAFSAGWHILSPVNIAIPELFVKIVTAFAIPFMVTTILLPAFLKAKEKVDINIKLQQLKHDPQIFEALLANQKKITHSTAGLGITLGRFDAPFKIIKVCNPYCKPCAMAHIPMDELLLNNPDIQIQIIFTAANNDADILNKPIAHLLAITENNDEVIIKKALDDWYLAVKKGL